MTPHPRYSDRQVADLPVDDGLAALLDELLVADANQAPTSRPVTRWTALAAAAAVVVAVAVPLALDRGDDAPAGPPGSPAASPSAPTSSDDGPRSDPPYLEVLPPAERGAPVELSGTTLDGEPLDLADLRGGVVVLNVWGGWCAPCLQRDLPLLGAAAEDLDATVVGVDVRESRASGLATQERFRLPYESLSLKLRDLEGIASGAPATVVLDARGRVMASIDGAIASDRVLRLLVDVTELPTLPDVLAEVDD